MNEVRVLLFYSSYHSDFGEEILKVLTNSSFHVDIVIPNILSVAISYDIAIVCDKDGYDKFKSLGLHIPLIYILLSGEYYKDMMWDSSLYIHMVMINTQGALYSNSYVTPLFIPFAINKLHLCNRETKYERLLVDVGNENALIYLLPLLNSYVDYKIDILTDQPERFSDIVNTHIKFSIKEDREKLIEESDILIAEGYTALKGVMMQKPVFVLGRCGFGGLIGKDNVEEHYHTGFSGRLGGVIDEYIPIRMIDFEIRKVLDEKAEGLEVIAEKLSKCCRETSDKLCRLISFFVNLPHQKGKVMIQKNNYMDYIHVDGGGVYWVVDKVYRKLLFEIDETEKRLVDYFDTPKQLNSVYKEMTGDLSHEEIEKSVDELLKYKLLDYCIYETIGREL